MSTLALYWEAAGTGVVLDLSEHRLPSVIYWGDALGPIRPRDAEAIAAAAVPVVSLNAPDRPIRLSLLPEHRDGWAGRPGVSGSRAGAAWSPAWTVRSVRLDGRALSASTTAGPGRLEIDAHDEFAELDLTLTLDLTPHGLLRCRARVTNTADSTRPAYQLDDLVIALPVPAAVAELLDTGGRWLKERIPQRTPFGFGTHLREGRRGRTGPDAATVLHAGTPGFGFAEGEIWAVHTAWSGNHTTYAEHVWTGDRVLGGGELLLPGEVILGPGQAYESPWVYGAHGHGLDDIARRFHRTLRSGPNRPRGARPVTINVWEAVYFDHDLDRLLDLAERAAALGVERFVLDDGWFGARRDDTRGLGDWVVSPDVWPDGLHPLVDRVRTLGMEFGLWVEPEMVNLDSGLARAHPDWVMAARPELPVPARNQHVLDLGNPHAYAHIRDQLLAILAEYDIAYLKWDHNRDLVEAGSSARAGAPGVHEQTLAAYRLMDELRAAHPGLEIESCSSGGARVDLEVLQHTQRVWASDCIDPHERQQILRWTGQLVPPEYLGSHIASGRSHSTGRIHDLGFRAATASFGHLGIEWDLAHATPQVLVELGLWVEFWKTHRELLLTGDVVRLDVDDPAVWVHGVVAPDAGEALFALVMMDTPWALPVPPVRLRGLDPTRRYAVRPVIVGPPPSGLRPPAWWGSPASRDAGASRDRPGDLPPGWSPGYPGAEFTGAALAGPGFAAPTLDPDQAVLFHLVATDPRRPDGNPDR